ncbi:coproporphyrinogen III oxidase, partial [Bacillus vallismortis]|nr:coproporphyrinogen III oxidase [Bacillus vallismortis]
MQIKIEGIHDDRLHRPLQNIANLFYEECELVYGGEEHEVVVISLDCLLTEERVT